MYTCRGCRHSLNGGYDIKSDICVSCFRWSQDTALRIKYHPVSIRHKKYKSIKPITLRDIVYNGVHPECDEFVEFAEQILGLNICYAWNEIEPETAQDILLSIKPDSTWFIDHGFIEEVKEERFWQVGDIVDGAIIAYIGNDQVALIPATGYASGFCQPENILKITLAEMRKMGYEGE